MYDSSVKDILIINQSEGMQKLSEAGTLVGHYDKSCGTNGSWSAGPIEIDRCTSFGVTFNISNNVKMNNY